MLIIKNAAQLSTFLLLIKSHQKQIGFVPTMGALHQGHISLIKKSIEQNELTICSIFVNPTQFNDPEDFKKYPVTIEHDVSMLESSGCNVLFLPETSEIYPDGTIKLTNYNLGFLETVLEGEFRPGHFQGVCQVVHRLLEIVLPTKLYLGQKDYQQCMVIKKLLELVKMDEVIKIIVVQTMRESDGLAMSSRNKRLDQNSRKKATAISKALYFVKENIKTGNPDEILQSAKSQLQSSGFTIDYLQLAYTDSLKPVTSWDGKQKVVVLVAAFLEGVRLIDNMMID